MTAYLSKQQSCFAELDGRRDYGDAPCSFNWHHQHPNSQHHLHRQQPCQRYHYGSVPGGATLPRKGGRMVDWHLESKSCRSPSHLAAIRAKEGSGDLWPSECGCHQSWQEPYQVKLLRYQTAPPVFHQGPVVSCETDLDSVGDS